MAILAVSRWSATSGSCSPSLSSRRRRRARRRGRRPRPATDLVDVLRARRSPAPSNGRASGPTAGWRRPSRRARSRSPTRAPAGCSTPRPRASASIRPTSPSSAHPPTGAASTSAARSPSCGAPTRPSSTRAGCWTTRPTTSSSTCSRPTRWCGCPSRGGLTLKMGKFTTPMGFEVIEAPEQPAAVSRSFLFGYAIPFTHTGVLATVQATPAAEPLVWRRPRLGRLGRQQPPRADAARRRSGGSPPRSATRSR